MTNNKYKILLVEDERNIRNLVKTILESVGYQVVHAATYKAAVTMYASHMPDLIILDLGLPDKDGIYLLNKVREESLTPVIVLSARTNETDKVEALDAGANDYITKPFGSAELLARVRSTLRNSRHSAEMGRKPGGSFVLMDLVIKYDARQVFIAGKEIKLTQTEYNIIAFLSENAGIMMTYAAIIKAIWGSSDEGSIKKLQVNMANIRKKFVIKPGENKYISNELGVGYRMNGEKEGL
jgi:two-component system KDP operon response regulator KdpE